MAKLLYSGDVFIGGEISCDTDPIEFHGGQNIGPLPTLYDTNWKYVEPANQWFIHLASTRRLENLSSYSRALLRYWSFLDKEDLVWDTFPPIKSLKPTYRFRNEDLLTSVKNGRLAYSTANTYMSHVVQFYLWAAHERLFSLTESNKPFEIEFVQIKRGDTLAHMMPKLVVQTSDLRIRVPKDTASSMVKGLNPLTQEMLQALSLRLHRESPETRLIVLLGIQCGFRIEEAAGLTLAAIKHAVPCTDSRSRYKITIGPNNGVPTKFNKNRTIEITQTLLGELHRYAIGERRLRRLDKLQALIKQYCSLFPEQELQLNQPLGRNKNKREILMAAQRYEPLFISQTGNPFQPLTMNTRFGEMRRSMMAEGQPFRHCFHDLRSSYATYRLQSLLDAGLDTISALDLLMQWMGHNHESTTWRYLRYLKRQEAIKEKIFMLDSIMHQAIEHADHK